MYWVQKRADSSQITSKTYAMNIFEIKVWLLLDTNCHVPTLNFVTLIVMLLRKCDSGKYYHEGDLKKKLAI